MLDAKVVELLNQQINKEFYSAYLYLDFSNYYYDQELNGFGNCTGFRHRKNAIMPCCFCSICKTTANA